MFWDVFECDGFIKCVSNDMGSEYDNVCNVVCDYGIYLGGWCCCLIGWYG